MSKEMHPDILEVQDLACLERDQGDPPCERCFECRMITKIMHIPAADLPPALAVVRRLSDGYLRARARAKPRP